MSIFYLIWSGVLGAIIGSFLNVVILRLPEEKTLGGRSACVNCGHELNILDLVPILSYVSLGGKCRYCQSNISSRYAIIESLTAGFFLFAYWWIMPDTFLEWLWVIRYWLILAVLIVVFVIDLEHFLILDKVTLSASLIILSVNLLIDWQTGSGWKLGESLSVGGLVTGMSLGLALFIMWWVSKGKWLGLGDAKLMPFLGLSLGFPIGYMAFFLSFILGSVYAVPFLLAGKYTLASRLPLGTFIAVAIAICLFFGQNLWQEYINWLGLN